MLKSMFSGLAALSLSFAPALALPGQTTLGTDSQIIQVQAKDAKDAAKDGAKAAPAASPTAAPAAAPKDAAKAPAAAAPKSGEY